MLAHTLAYAFYNFLGTPLSERIIVFESDDWGMIRTSSRDALNSLSKKYPLKSCLYSSNDALERESDVQGLLEVLSKHRSNSFICNKPKFTLNCVTHNPDFSQIEKSQFKSYFRETNTVTYHRYKQSDRVPLLMKKGVDEGFFVPQFHATEHININNWLCDLQKGDVATLEAFSCEMANLHKESRSNCHKEHLDAFGYRSREVIESLEATLKVGLNSFETLYGYESQTMIAPCYLWDNKTERAAIAHGVKAFQGGTVQKIPLPNGFKKRRHYMGQLGDMGQRYFIRNCQFEMIDNPNKDWVDSCLKDIEIAFRFKKPAIISTHRVNYIGRLNESNRSVGLKLLDQLLKQINKSWPDVQYLSTPELLSKYYH